MKRQTQVPGIRRWFADDFLELQSEAITALDAIVGAYNQPCVVAGCELSNGLITPGFVALSIDGEGLKMMPFDGNIAAPCYLVAKKTEVNSVYADGISRLSAYQYKAIAQSQLPSAEVSYIKVETNGKCDRLFDVMQDPTHRMVTDAEKGIWDSKETPAGAQAKATQAQRDAEVSAIKFADYAREDAKRYTDDVAATKAEALIEVAKPVSDRNATWFYSPNGYNAGRNVYFGTAENGLRLTSHETSETLSYIKTRNGVAGDRHTVWTDDNFNPSEYVKSAELSGYMQVYAAGKISGDGNTPTLYTGKPIIPKKIATGVYRVSHSFGSTNYMVNITPVSGANRSFSVAIKSTTYFEVQFDLTTDFEFQILKY